MDQFFMRYYPMFVAFAYNFIKDQSVCEDITQESFISLLERQDDVCEENTTKGFLYRIIRNKCLNHLRHEEIKNRYASRCTEEYNRNVGSQEFFIDAIIREEASTIVIDAIEQLPEMAQRVINMAVNGLSNQEIADALEISINTVRTHKSRAYQTLRIVLSNAKLLLLC